MSVEQLNSCSDIDSRTDVYATGVVLFEMATGTPPFRGNTSGVVFNEILTKTPDSVLRINPDLPVALAHIIDKALEKDDHITFQAGTHDKAIRMDMDDYRKLVELKVLEFSYHMTS